MTSSSIMAGRKAISLAAVAVAALATLGTSAQPSVAQGPGEASLAYSADGVSYSAQVPELFAQAPKLVPGEGVEENLWVRNDHGVPVDIFVAALTAGPPVDQPKDAPPQSSLTLEPGAAAALPVRVWLPVDSDNDSQARTWPLMLHVNVSEAVPESGVDPGWLMDTGATPGIWPVGTALFLGGLGAWLGARRRRSREQNTGSILEGAQP